MLLEYDWTLKGQNGIFMIQIGSLPALFVTGETGVHTTVSNFLSLGFDLLPALEGARFSERVCVYPCICGLGLLAMIVDIPR